MVVVPIGRSFVSHARVCDQSNLDSSIRDHKAPVHSIALSLFPTARPTSTFPKKISNLNVLARAREGWEGHLFGSATTGRHRLHPFTFIKSKAEPSSLVTQDYQALGSALPWPFSCHLRECSRFRILRILHADRVS